MKHLHADLAGGLTITLLLTMGLAPSAPAQIATDATLGTAAQPLLAGPGSATVVIPAALGRLECDAPPPMQTRCNLFHSFSEFNIQPGQTASFGAPEGHDPAVVSNILARVTGGSGSNIEGTLNTRSMPQANFFLMNPKGVVFDPGAKLEVGGAFVVTTANELHLADGGRLATMDVELTDATLTVAAPSAFGFLNAEPQGVTIAGVAGDPDNATDLKVDPGKALSVVSGDMTVINGKVQAPSGRVNVISVASPGRVEFDATAIDAPVELDSSIQLGDVSLSDRSDVNIDGDGGGRLVIRAEDVTADGAFITAQTLGDVDGGLIDIALTGDLVITNEGAIEAAIEDGGTGDGRAIRVEARNVSILNEGLIGSRSETTGDGGAIDLDVDQALVMDNFSGLFAVNNGLGDGGDIHVDADSVSILGAFDGNFENTTGIAAVVGSAAEGTGGDVVINTRTLDMANFAVIGASTLGPGDGGNVDILATESLSIGSPDALFFSGISVQTIQGVGGGDAGQMTIITGSLEMVNGAILNTNTLGTGLAGDIRITADRIYVDHLDNMFFPTGIFAQAFPQNIPPDQQGIAVPGTAGNIEIDTGSLEVVNGAQVSATTTGSADGGSITIFADDILLDDQFNSAFFTSITAQTQADEPGVGGKGGDITIGGRGGETLTLRNAAGISASTFGTGAGGDIIIDVETLVLENNSEIESESNGTDTVDTQFGRSGDIEIHATKTIWLSGQSAVATTAFQADAGKVVLEAGMTIDLIDRSAVSAQAGLNGGSVTLNAPQRISLHNSTVTAEATENGGNITMDPILVDLQQGSRVIANAMNGDGGSIKILTEILRRSPDSVIDASSQFGVSGTVDINSNLDLAGSLVTLPVSLLTNQAQLSPRCAAQFSGNVSSFTVQYSSVVPIEPGGWLPSSIRSYSPLSMSEGQPKAHRDDSPSHENTAAGF